MSVTTPLLSSRILSGYTILPINLASGIIENLKAAYLVISHLIHHIHLKKKKALLMAFP